jgi:hypothetical protein
MLPTISIEQQDVVEKIRQGYNVVCNSVAGSGKTTCNLHLASIFSEKNLVLITYNAKLKIETREKINQLNLPNIETHSYHSFCRKYYDNECVSDSKIRTVFGLTPLIPFQYDILILDEAQDMNPLYYRFVRKVLTDNQIKTNQIVVLGDENQSIFGFNGADQRYITFADQLFKQRDILWSQAKLSQSYRITSQMAEFLNECMLNEQRIFSQKISKHSKPKYIICNTFKQRPFQEFQYYVDVLGYSPEEIFILAPSVKSEITPIRELENQIKFVYGNRVPIFCPTNDSSPLDEDILDGKLIFSTFHQSKGLERKVVFVYNFDESYFKFYKRESDQMRCPNELYVAATRAMEHIVFFHHFENDYLPFLQQSKLETYTEFEEFDKMKKKKEKPMEDSMPVSVTKLLSHIPSEVMDDCFDKLSIEKVRKRDKVIQIPLKVKQYYNDESSGMEGVCELTGIAIPNFYEFQLKGKMGIYEHLLEWSISPPQPPKYESPAKRKIRREIHQHLSKIDLQKMSIKQLLYICNAWKTRTDGYLFKIYQIKNYDWLSDKNLKLCMSRFDTLQISPESVFEKQLEYKIKNYEIMLHGNVDCLDRQNVYEFKCVQKLEKEHYLQLALYMFLNESVKENKDDVFHYYLYNILTDEMFEVKCEMEKLNEMIELLIRTKYSTKSVVDDETFLKLNLCYD